VRVDVVACGYAYTCVAGRVEERGVERMWSFGANENGRLGTGDTDDKFLPTVCKFEEDEKIKVKVIKAGR